MFGSDKGGDTETKRDVLKEIIKLCQGAIGNSVDKADPSFGPKNADDAGSADVLGDKPDAIGKPDEEDEEKEFLKRFGEGS
jgi:hypothetical protein